MTAIPEKMERYPIGQQDFKVLRERGNIYVDKTEFIQKIVESGAQYHFLARPRRFGKSLFLSTLRYFYEGKRELFKGLYIDSTDWKWEKYPVLRLDLNTDRYAEMGKLEPVLDYLFKKWETEYGVEDIPTELSQRFKKIIETAHGATGKKVVILVDEYDKPLVGNLNKQDYFEHYRSQLASLYSNFKSSAEDIELVFLTGVSRFSKLSVFSDLNNINDITFDNEYADICGITEKEMLEYFQEGIQKLALALHTDYEGTLRELKRNYDGYRFAPLGSDIYNPWSLLSALSKSTIENYWNATGFPAIIVETLKRMNLDLEETMNKSCRMDDLKGLDLLNPEPTSLMYQTGYLTIKSYNQRLRRVRLGIPNNEIKEGLYNILLPKYVTPRRGTANDEVGKIIEGFFGGDPEDAMCAMQAFFAGIDYKMKMDDENNFHNAFFLLTHIIGLDAETEVHTSDGSIDIKIETEDFIYIIELKYDHTAEEAIRQIEEKQYARPWQTDPRQTFLIGANFSSKTRCIEDWIVKEMEEK